LSVLSHRIEVASTTNSRIFAYRDYKRRLMFLDRIMMSGNFSIRIFDMYNIKNLFKLLYTLENFSFEDLEISRSHSIQLRLLIGKFLKSKCTLPNVPLALNKDLLITIFTSPDLDKIGLNSILRSPEVLNALPPCARKIWNHPKVVFKYVKTLGQKAFNYVDLGRNISEHAKMAILGNPCCCSNDGYSPFVNESLGHIVTTNCSILPSETLKELFMKGTKFRLAPSKESCLLMAINKGISNFVTRVEESLGVQGILSHWKTMILKKASLKLATLSSSRGSSSGISLSSSDLHSLRKFFRNFVISYVNKCS
jgi:hypothetical protein